MIPVTAFHTKTREQLKWAQKIFITYQQSLNGKVSLVFAVIKKFYGFAVFVISELFECLAFILSSIAKFTLLVASKLSTFSHYTKRRLYVWKILSTRKKWYVNKEGSFYNPKLKATIRPNWECSWTLSRLQNQYNGFESKEIAQDAAFKMWMKKRRLESRLDMRDIAIKIPLNLSEKILSNKINLRKASPKDADLILTFLENLGHPKDDENMKARIQAYSYGNHNHILIAEKGKIIVGFIAFIIYDLFACKGKRCHIEKLVVDSSPSGLSIKRKLMQSVESFVRDNEGTFIDLMSDSARSEQTTHDFYKFMGYENDNSSAKTYLRKEL